jgi:hypothetical protein
LNIIILTQGVYINLHLRGPYGPFIFVARKQFKPNAMKMEQNILNALEEIIQHLYRIKTPGFQQHMTKDLICTNKVNQTATAAAIIHL